MEPSRPTSPKGFSSHANISLNPLLFLLLGGLISLFLFSSFFSANHFFFPIYTNHKHDSSNHEILQVYKDELGEALEKAAMGNKTVIIAIVNKAYVEHNRKVNTNMLDIFLESFWLGEGTRELLDQILVVAVDGTAYDRCRFRGLHCYKLETDDVDFAGEKLYMSQDFIKMMWRRTLFLLDVLKRGYSFVFTDTDVLWLRNPFHKLSKNHTIDLQISTDEFSATSKNQLINTGFYYIRSNSRSIALFEKWYSLRDNSTGLKEQDVLLRLVSQGIFQELGLQVRYLDTRFFSGFCEDSKDMEAVTTVHANCCRSIGAKLKDLVAVLRDWERYNRYKTNEKYDAASATRNFKWTKHLGCWDSWKTIENTT